MNGWVLGRLAGGMAMAVAMVPPVAAAELEEIVVTATRRDASILDVPVAVSALTAQQLERTGVKDLKDLPSLSPSLSLHYTQTESQGTTLRLRGIGTTGNNIGLESSVGVFLDGVYLSRPGVALADLFDVEQIEVMRGPQGTLFGRNTSAGAINIRTIKPDLHTMEVFGSATFGNFDTRSLQLGVNVPLIDDTLALRLSGATRDQDALVESTTGAKSHTRDRYTLRGQLLWAASDRFDVRLIADYTDTDEQCCDAPILLDPLNGSGVFDAAGLPSDGGAAEVGETAYEERISNAGQFENSMEQWGLSAELNWHSDIGTLTYLLGYRDYEAPTVQDVDFVALDVVRGPGPSTGHGAFDRIKTSFHEIRLQGLAGRLDWLLGASYVDERIDEVLAYEAGADYSRYATASAWYGLFYAPGGVYGSLPAVDQATLDATPLPAGSTPTFGSITSAAFTPPADLARLFAGGASAEGLYGVNRFEQDATAWSVFTHNTLHLSDTLDLTLGLRWAEEEKDGSYHQIASGNTESCFNAQANAGAVASAPYAVPAVAALMSEISVGLAQLACFPFLAPADPTNPLLPQEFDTSFDDSELVYTLALGYAPAESISAYASHTHGFKSGGINLDSTAASLGADPRFDSEKVDAYELGLKGELLDHRLRIHLALFRMDLEDFQVLDFNGVQFKTFNVPKVKNEGFELEVTARPTDYLSLDLGVTYADARYPGDCADGLDPAPRDVTTLCGSRLMNAPKWTSVAGATLEGRLFSSGLRGFITAYLRHETDRRTGTRAVEISDLSLLPFDVQESNTKVNLRIGVGQASGRWTAELWANNVFDERTRQVTFNVPLRGLGLAHTAARGVFIDEPRTIGATLRIAI